MKQLPELLRTAALNLRGKHQNVDLATLENAVNIGAKLAVEALIERVKQERVLTISHPKFGKRGLAKTGMTNIIHKYPNLRCIKMMEVRDGKVVPGTEAIFVEQIVKRNLFGFVFLDKKLCQIYDDDNGENPLLSGEFAKQS